MDFFEEMPSLGRRDLMNLRKGIDAGFRSFSRSYGEALENFFDPLLQFLIFFEKLLIATPWPIILLIVAGLTWLGSRSWKIVVGSLLCFMLIGYLGMWEDTMSTVAMISVATLICISIGIPIGVLMSRSDRVQATITPVLDVMQTIPSFVYLIPVVMLLGIGKVPGGYSYKWNYSETRKAITSLTNKHWSLVMHKSKVEQIRCGAPASVHSLPTPQASSP